MANEDQRAFELLVVGGGPAGYVAAIRGAQEGLKTGLVEADRLGGICLNWGCIPTKALLRSAEIYSQSLRAKDFGITVGEVGFHWPSIVRRSRQVADRISRGVNYLMKKNGITVFSGRGILEGGGRVRVEGEKETAMLSAKNIILATGARARTIGPIKIDGERVLSSREAMVLQEVPGSIVIVGAGVIGIEFAYLFRTFGAEVTVVEMLERILPLEDRELSGQLKEIFLRQGMKILTGARVKNIEVGETGCLVEVERAGQGEKLSAERVLMAVGVQGNVEEIGLETAGVDCESGFIKTGGGYRTTARGIWASGDCIGAPLLAHAASAEAVLAMESILGGKDTRLDRNLVPSCTYCKPQLAGVGLSEQAAQEAGHDVAVGRFPFRPLGKAVADGEQDGLVKVVVDRKSKELLGVHILGAEATEMISEAAAIMTSKAGAGMLHQVIHPHPTLSEALAEAAGDALGKAIHL